MGRNCWTSLVGILVVASPSCAGHARGDESLASQTPESALVAFELDGKFIALRLEKESQIAILQSCFPNFRSRPAGEGTASWKPKYEIYFNFARGQSVRVFVSSNSRYWSTGQGALEMRGAYFNNIIHELLKEMMRTESAP